MKRGGPSGPPYAVSSWSVTDPRQGGCRPFWRRSVRAYEPKLIEGNKDTGEKLIDAGQENRPKSGRRAGRRGRARQRKRRAVRE